jgi:raffinose/stachyose/melibiose transport system permease protein
MTTQTDTAASPPQPATPGSTPGSAGAGRSLRRRLRDLPLSITLHLIALLVAAFVLTPLFFAVLGGFKDTGQLSRNPFLLPDPWIPANYTDILADPILWRSVLNSLIIAAGTVLLLVTTAALAAYAFARFAFRGREIYFTLFATGLMFPFAVAILPLFIMLRTLGLLDNPLGVILPQAAFGLPVTIIILRTFFRSIPAEIEEAATLDGCSAIGFFWRILIPMARPALATVSVLAIVASWNNFMLPLVVINDQNWWTLPIGVQQFQGQYSSDTAKVLAYVTIAMIPAVIFFGFAERHLVQGLTSGATKG